MPTTTVRIIYQSKEFQVSDDQPSSTQRDRSKELVRISGSFLKPRKI